MLHPIVVHLPIDCLLIAFILEQTARFHRADTSFHSGIHISLLVGMITAVMSVATGLMLAEKGGYDDILRWRHQWVGISLTAVTLLLYGIKRNFFNNNLLKKIEPVLWWCLLPLLTITGHYGGSMTHGADYLSGSGSQSPKDAGPINEALIYEDIVAPILAEKCLNCHTGNKVRGGLRMDTLSMLLKGGKSGAAILPGQPWQSRMMQYILLPDTAALHMPPKGHVQLLPHEIAFIEWWIQCGAPERTKIRDLEQNERIRPLLFAIQGTEGNRRSDIPVQQVAPAHPDTLSALRELGIVVVPVAAGSPYLKANMLHTGVRLGEAIHRLQAIKKQLIWLETAHPELNDSHVQEISRLEGLTRLNLSHACISDQALQALTKLKELQSLNLFDTPVTDQGLSWITRIPALQTLYLYQTGVSPQAASATQQAFPELQLERGGYQTGFYPTDTIEYKYTPVK